MLSATGTMRSSVPYSPKNGQRTCSRNDLLCYLMQQPGRVVGRETLLRQVWGYEYAEDLRTVDVHVQRLRGKNEADPANPNLLRTVRGFGYCLTI
jgi:DNA-binding response OmpR family regulator